MGWARSEDGSRAQHKDRGFRRRGGAPAHRSGAARALYPGQGLDPAEQSRQLARLVEAARQASFLGLGVHAGHGLTYLNTAAVVAIPEIEEVNIGHSIVSHAVFVGIERAVREMKELIGSIRGRM